MSSTYSISKNATPGPLETGTPTINTPPPTPTNFRVRTRAVLLTWSALRREPTAGLVARHESFCRSHPNHWRTRAVVENHDPDSPSFDPERPLHIHALTISVDRRGGWETRNPRFWDFEGNHPNIVGKDLTEGPGGVPAMTAFHYLWKAVGENGEEVEDLMAGELTEEDLSEMVIKGKGEGGGKWPRMQADLEDGEEIVSAESREEYFSVYKRLRPLQMTTAWNSVRAYADYAYKEDPGLLEPIPVALDFPVDREHINQADAWFQAEVPVKAQGMRHKILVIEGETGTGKTAYIRSKGTHSCMCNVWNVGALSKEADI